jgi:hypothetical protein
MGGHRAEQCGLVSEHRQLREAVGPIGDGHGHVGEHDAGVVGVPGDPTVAHGQRQPLGQPRSVGQLGQQSGADVGHQSVTVGGHLGAPDRLATMHLQGALLLRGLCCVRTRILPGQEGFFAELRPVDQGAARTIEVKQGGPDGQLARELLPLALAVRTMPSANSGMTWLRNSKVRSLLAGLATGETPLTQEGLDALPASRSVEYIRGLLVEQKMLPARNEQVAVYGRWLEGKLGAMEDPERRRLIETFGRWNQLRGLRRTTTAGPMTGAAFLRAKQSTTLAIEFLEWLAARGRTLADCTQRDIDAWFASGPSTRSHTQSFLYWAINARQVKGIEMPPHTERAHPAIGEDERIDAVRQVLLDDTLELPWRIAGGLVLLFGQPAQCIAELRIDQVDVADDQVRLLLARDWLHVPEPFASLLREYLGRRRNMATPANTSARWLFPGGMPGRPVTAASIVLALRTAGIPVRAARNGTWQQLVREAPPSVLAEALGISPKTAMQHAERAGADWLRYAALRNEPPA